MKLKIGFVLLAFYSATNVMASELVCSALYENASGAIDQSFDFTKKLKKENPDAIYISATKEVKSKDSRYKILGHASLNSNRNYQILIEVTDLKTGVVSSSFAKNHGTTLIVKDAQSPNITRMLNVECNLRAE